ncbi:MAG: GntR family transcriptional regulator [Parasporobacterium sp.]|nr:GntR family transcriptional regulator [Parasporobacterium sp.]
MFIQIDFNSEEALYVQLRNQIILGIATSQLKEGETLPSVRAMADTIGINMHTVNKAYTCLRQDGFVRVDRRRGAIIAVDMDKLRALAVTKDYLRPIIARAIVKGITKEEAFELVEEIYKELQ